MTEEEIAMKFTSDYIRSRTPNPEKRGWKTAQSFIQMQKKLNAKKPKVSPDTVIP